VDVDERNREREAEQQRERVARASSDAERKRLLSLLEQLPAVVNVLRGPELVFEFAHPKAAALWGGRELVGKPLLEAIPGYQQQREVPERIRRVYETGQPSSFHDVPVRAAAGVEGVAYWDSIYLPIFDAAGAVEGVLTFDLDVTEWVLARQEMERVNRAKDEFLATMSHELRTPLNAIHGWTTILQKKPLEQGDLAHGLEVIERNVQAQVRLVGDLLDVSRIITGKLELRLQQTSLFPLIVAAVDIVRPAAEGKGVRLVFDVDPEIGETVVDPDGPFDLIISDIGMPEVDGYEFIRTLRARSAVPHVPAIALTAYARLQDVELAKKAGFQEHLPKPVDERLLLKTVKRWSRPAGTSAPS
jgi:CheY-like chemotaxis protein